MYQHVMVENPSYTTADETDRETALKSMLRHPLSYARFLSYLNKSARNLLGQYFRDPEIFKFFDKLTSTYCYATLEEAPAVLAAVMFVDNHVGGSYYPAGSTLFLPGKLEKVIEENGGDMLLEREVVSICFENGKPAGVVLNDGRTLKAPHIIYSGTVWNLYGKLIDPIHSTAQRRDWAKNQEPTYPSVVLYAVVSRDIIPEDTAPIEMLVGNPDRIDESEVTAYILSIDDRTLCGEDEQTVLAIGPTFETWDALDESTYPGKKLKEQDRLIAVMEKAVPRLCPGCAVRRGSHTPHHRAVHDEEWRGGGRPEAEAGTAHVPQTAHAHGVGQPFLLRRIDGHGDRDANCHDLRALGRQCSFEKAWPGTVCLSRRDEKLCPDCRPNHLPQTGFSNHMTRRLVRSCAKRCDAGCVSIPPVQRENRPTSAAFCDGSRWVISSEPGNAGWNLRLTLDMLKQFEADCISAHEDQGPVPIREVIEWISTVQS